MILIIVIGTVRIIRNRLNHLIGVEGRKKIWVIVLLDSPNWLECTNTQRSRLIFTSFRFSNLVHRRRIKSSKTLLKHWEKIQSSEQKNQKKKIPKIELKNFPYLIFNWKSLKNAIGKRREWKWNEHNRKKQEIRYCHFFFIWFAYILSAFLHHLNELTKEHEIKSYWTKQKTAGK